MLIYKTGNILDDDADWIVNPVNCMGVMGAGLAKQFKEKYPKYFKSYKELCDMDDFYDMLPSFHHTINKESERQIISFPTKKHWRNPSQIEWIENGLKAIVRIVDWWSKESDIKCKSIAFPALGVGLGGLKWEDVKLLLENFAKQVPDIEVRVYLPK